jgi:Zn-dependent M28 family amino/carboxypeptidase
MKIIPTLFTILLFVLWIPCSYATQVIDSTAVKYSAFINKSDLEKHLRVLASDEYQGRETAKAGQKMAARYIADHFKKIGIKPIINGDYYQVFHVIEQKPSGSISIQKKEYSFLNDFFFFPGIADTVMDIKNIVFAGYGIKTSAYNDYHGIDVKGKVVVILEGEPYDKKGKSIISKKRMASEWTKERKLKSNLAKDLGAAALIVISANYQSDLAFFGHFVEKPSMTLERDADDDEQPKKRLRVFYVSEQMGAGLLGKERLDSAVKNISAKKKPQSGEITTEMHIKVQREKERLSSENVLGYIEGTDLKEELLILTAHYDHIGMEGDVVFNGADDDGSGTVALLEIAEAFQMASQNGFRPRRSVLIMPVSGEEKGLLGSFYYSENPVFPLENTIANLNIDMIGRIDTFHSGNPDYVYLIGSDILSKELHEISENANKTYTNLELDYRFNNLTDPNRFYFRSDHYNFAKKNIPVIFYFNGVHADYHKSTDDVEKINFSKIEKITRLVFFTAWDLANRDKRPALNK